MKRFLGCMAAYLLVCGLPLSPSFGITTVEALSGLKAYALESMEEEKVPGLSYVVVKDGEIIATEGLGVREAGKAAPVTPQTVFEIGSTTKAFTATLVAMMVDEGKLAWNDKVITHLPDFKMNDPWTTKEMEVQDLLCQRSGIPAYALTWMNYLGFSRDRLVRALRFVEPVTSFRSAFAYQNAMLTVAAELVEKKTNRSWDDNLDLRLFRPLGMKESTSRQEVVDTMKDVARGHERLEDGSLWTIPADWRFQHVVDSAGPAGGIRSSARDLGKWVRFQLDRGAVTGQRLVSEENMNYLFAPKTLVTAGPDPASYASGWVYLSRSPHALIHHSGGIPGYSSHVALIPDAKVGIALLCNRGEAGSLRKILEKFYELFSGQSPSSPPLNLDSPLAPMPAPPRPHDRRPGTAAVQSPPLPLDRYRGVYANPAYGKFKVVREAYRLVAFWGPKHLKTNLEPFSGSTFLISWPDYPGLNMNVTFSVLSGAPADHLVISELRDVDRGVFKRVE